MNFGGLSLQRVLSKDLAARRIFVSPPEPPKEYLIDSPTHSVYLGKTMLMKMPVYWNFKNLTNPHIGVIGITGSGKSYLVKTFLTRASLVWNTNALILDWVGEYVEWVKQVGGKVLSLGKGDYINLLDLGGMSPSERVKQIMSSLDILISLSESPYQKRFIEESVEAAYEKAGFLPDSRTQKKGMRTPTLIDVERILKARTKTAETAFQKDELEQAAYKLKGFTAPGRDYFARESTINLERLTSSGLVCVDLHGLPNDELRSLAGLTILQFLKERMRDEGWTPEKGLRLFVVLDEAWKIAQDERSDAITIVREGRKYQFGLIVASQNPTDVNKAIISNVGTMFVMRLHFREFKDHVRSSLGYSDFIQSEIDKFGVGNAAINMIFQTRAKFAQTFLLDKVDGEEPLIVLGIMVGDKMEIKFEKEELYRKFAELGLTDKQVHEIINLFDNGHKKVDIVRVIELLEKMGYARPIIVSFLRDIGVVEDDVIKLFSRMQKKKMGVDGDKISRLVVKDDDA